MKTCYVTWQSLFLSLARSLLPTDNFSAAMTAMTAVMTAMTAAITAMTFRCHFLPLTSLYYTKAVVQSSIKTPTWSFARTHTHKTSENRSAICNKEQTQCFFLLETNLAGTATKHITSVKPQRSRSWHLPQTDKKAVETWLSLSLGGGHYETASV